MDYYVADLLFSTSVCCLQ